MSKRWSSRARRQITAISRNRLMRGHPMRSQPYETIRYTLAIALSLSATSAATAQRSGAGSTTQSAFEVGDVAKPAKELPSSARPQYPNVAKMAAIHGRVQAEFIVDTLGVPDSASIRILESPHPLLSAAVKHGIPRMRFSPAERAGKKVRQVVRLPFTFEPGGM
jgi:TonB family protein